MSEGSQTQRPKMSRIGRGLGLIIVTTALLLGACSGASSEQGPSEGSLVVPDPAEVYDPYRAGETMPDGYRQVLGRDSIHPIYEPVFVAANQVDWPENTDVIGVAGEDESKAYPVSHLSFREMVIDDIAGIPILVSW